MRGPKPRPLADRLVERSSEPDERGCVNWTGAKNAKGYGVMRVSPRNVLTHRVSWELRFGEVPDGAFILHKCDNPACVNPDHLFLGSKADNNADMRAKGRARGNRNGTPPVLKGERHHQAKLTRREVDIIRRSQDSSTTLAKEYGVCASTIRQARRGKTWAE